MSTSNAKTPVLNTLVPSSNLESPDLLKQIPSCPLLSTMVSSNSHHPSQHHQHNPSHHHHHLSSTISPSSLSTEEYSSRYSSLQDTESLKSAILDSFRMHWIQAWSIMECKILNDITMDDLSSIVNHIEQMISLLVEENATDVRTINSFCESKTSEQTSASSESETIPMSLSPLLDFLFMESILEKIFQWSEMSGEWKCAMYMEQLKLYELLISQLCQADMMLFQQPFLRPLTRLLDALSLYIRTSLSLVNCVEIEKRLVILLNTLCVAISQNNRLLDVFLVYSASESKNLRPNKPSHQSSQVNSIESSLLDSTENGSIHCDNLTNEYIDQNCFSFPIFLLLIQFVHRNGAIGQQSRDALLLCLSLSRHDDRLANYVVNRTDFCPVLATGLSGLFSSLPRVLIGQSMTAEQFQFKDDLLHDSKEIDQFLKCLDFCNAVAQISHPIIQVRLLNFIYNGFLVSVIGPALHQDVAQISINELESLSTYSNTLDEIITTTAYLDLFIRTISEPNLIRIFLEFLCFEVCDSCYITQTLINRISAKSKLSLITLILFKTLLDLNCEDLLFELIFKHLLRGKHVHLEIGNDNSKGPSYDSYKQNWLSISSQKLFSNSLSHYLSSLCSHQSALLAANISDSVSVSSFDSVKSCKCHSGYFLNYLDYLNDARVNIDQCVLATKSWKNSYSQPNGIWSDINEQSIIFSSPDANLNNNKADDDYDLCEKQNGVFNFNENSQEFQLKNGISDQMLSKQINLEVLNKNADHVIPVANGKNTDHHNENSNSIESPPEGLFLHILFERLEKFFENDVLTNLHLTGLITRLCHFRHKLLLSLFFDETLSRVKGVPCLLHLLQKLSLEAQNYSDELPNFESMFQTAKINLQSVPIGELNCQLLTGNHRARTIVPASKPKSNLPEVPHRSKGFGKLKSLFFRSSGSSDNAQSPTTTAAATLNRRNSNVSTVSSTGQMLEVIPGGVRFINQHPLSTKDGAKVNEKFNELIYNLIIFDEFIMELSAILIEHSIRQFKEDELK